MFCEHATAVFQSRLQIRFLPLSKATERFRVRDLEIDEHRCGDLDAGTVHGVQDFRYWLFKVLNCLDPYR